MPDSPSPRASADTLFLPTSRVPEEQRQSRRKKNLAVAEMYLNYEQLVGGRPSISKIASEHKVSRKFVWKIESELYTNNRCVVSPEEIMN